MPSAVNQGSCPCGGVGPTCAVCDQLLSGRPELALNYTNVLIGSGSASLLLQEPCLWAGTANCVDYTYDARVDPPILIATAHVGDGCAAASFECRSDGASPGLVLTSSICDPEQFNTYKRGYGVSSANCGALWTRGYTTYTVSN